jgi:hypothetical protein
LIDSFDESPVRRVHFDVDLTLLYHLFRSIEPHFFKMVSPSNVRVCWQLHRSKLT